MRRQKNKMIPSLDSKDAARMQMVPFQPANHPHEVIPDCFLPGLARPACRFPAQASRWEGKLGGWA
jgi:hypothetical protein